MSPRTATAAHGRFTATRLAWLASFFVTVALIALLGLVRSAQATPLLPSGPGAPSALLPFPEVEQLDDEAEETEEAEEEEEGDDELAEQWAECEELEEGEEQEACEEELEEQEEEEALEECTLSQTETTVSANDSSNTLRVVVHYRTYEPGKVAVQYRLHGGKGTLKLDRKTGHFARRGAFHDTRHLAQAEMTKVLAARQITVELQPVGAPDFCDGLFDEHLGVKHSGGSGRLWSD